MIITRTLALVGLAIAGISLTACGLGSTAVAAAPAAAAAPCNEACQSVRDNPPQPATGYSTGDGEACADFALAGEDAGTGESTQDVQQAHAAATNPELSADLASWLRDSDNGTSNTAITTTINNECLAGTGSNPNPTVNWYANGKAFAIADYNGGDTASLIAPLTPQSWCQNILTLSPIPPGAPNTIGTAPSQWVSGCVAGYYAARS
jgi:hypothetical protein